MSGPAMIYRMFGQKPSYFVSEISGVENGKRWPKLYQKSVLEHILVKMCGGL